MIDLRSDTLTAPSPSMLRAMFDADVGDDAFGEDVTTNRLEEYCAALFGKEAAVFTPTGTMSNQIALRLHTRPGDDVILDESYHFNVYESAPSASLAHVSFAAVKSPDGILTPENIAEAIDSKCHGQRYFQATLITLENTINYRSGRVVPFQELQRVSEFAMQRRLRLHLDGARIFNAAVASGTKPAEYGSIVDTLSVCFAKGLGAPFGSILVGPEPLIAEARRYRKAYGGALHQCGHLAGAALYALQHNIPRLSEDHATARQLAHLLAGHRLLRIDPGEVQTNIVIADLRPCGLSADAVAVAARSNGLLVMPISDHHVRFVTHMGITMRDVDKAATILLRTLAESQRPRDRQGGRRRRATALPARPGAPHDRTASMTLSPRRGRTARELRIPQ